MRLLWIIAWLSALNVSACFAYAKALRTLPTIRFCETQPDKEECYNLAPVVKYLHHEADLLNAFFIDHEKEVEDLNAV